MERIWLLSQLISKKESLFWMLFPGILSIIAWYFPGITHQDKTYFIFATVIIVICVLAIRAFWELLGECVSARKELQHLQANHSIPRINLSSELRDSPRVLSTYEYSGELRLIVSESPSLSLGTVVTFFYKNGKGGIEQYFGIGVVRFTQSDGKVQIAINNINFEPELSREKLIRKDTKLLKSIKLSTVIYMEFLKDWSTSP